MHPRVAAARRPVAVVGHRDRLQRHPPARGQQPVADGEVLGPVLLAHRLEHLDRDDLVEAPVQLAVVAEQDLDPALEAGRAHAPLGQLLLLPGDGDRRDPAAAGGGRVHRHPAPAGADLEHVVALADAGQIAHGVVLAPLRVGQRVARLEHGAGVGHGLVQEGREQVVRQVVVAGDVGAGAGGRVPLHARLQRLVHAPQPLQRPRHQRATAARRTPTAPRPGRRPPTRPPRRPRRSRSCRRRPGGGRRRPTGSPCAARPAAGAAAVRRARSPPAAPARPRIARTGRARSGRGPAGAAAAGSRACVIPRHPAGVWSGRRTRGTPRSHSLTPL